MVLIESPTTVLTIPLLFFKVPVFFPDLVMSIIFYSLTINILKCSLLIIVNSFLGLILNISKLYLQLSITPEDFAQK